MKLGSARPYWICLSDLNYYWMLFGLVPALQTSRPEIVGNLKEGTLGSGTGVSHQHFRSGLVIVNSHCRWS
jgi:hypothetical protein